MKNKFYISLSALWLLVGCAVEENVYPQPVIVVNTPRPPLYPSSSSVGVILKKRILSDNREQYFARLANGREIYFTVDTPLNYQIGDQVILP